MPVYLRCCHCNSLFQRCVLYNFSVLATDIKCKITVGIMMKSKLHLDLLQNFHIIIVTTIHHYHGTPIPPQTPRQQIPQIKLPLRIIQTPPNFKGDSQGGKKPATLECGAVVQIPFHLVEGDIIKCDTKTGDYLEKVK